MQGGGPSGADVPKWDAAANSLRVVVVSNNATGVSPGIDAVNVFVQQDLAHSERLRTFLDENVPVNAVVLGAGLLGLELATALSERGLSVTLIEPAVQALPAFEAEISAWVEAELVRCGVRLLAGSALHALLLAQDGHVEAVETKSGERIATDLVLLPATSHAAPSPSALGTGMGRVFGLDVGMTGLGLRAARSAGYDAESVSVHALVHLLVVYERASGKLLGAQAVGAKGVDKHLSVLATALHFGATLADLAALDLACAPHAARR